MRTGLKTLQTASRSASRRERIHDKFDDADYDDKSANCYFPPRRRFHSESHQEDVDDFNDSSIGPDADDPFLTSSQSGERLAYASTGANEPKPCLTGAVTPPSYSSRILFSDYSTTDILNQAKALPSFSSAF